MYILFCGGGTAGHVEPALAIAAIFKKRMPDIGIRFIGRSGGSENRRIEAEGYALQTLPLCGLQRKLSLRQIESITQTLRAVRLLKKQFKSDPPALVVGTGGYVSFPVLYAAASLGIKTAVHESNAVFGLTVRLLRKKMDVVMVNMPPEDKRMYKQTNILRVGMPVRQSITHISRAAARSALGLSEGDRLILSFGGSLGAQRINEVCIRLMEEYSAPSAHTYHIHGCGKRYYDSIAKTHARFCTSENRCRILPYIDDMPRLLRAADLVICRSGASTVAEVCAAGVPAVFIPSPHVTADHQYKNAKYLADAGACLLFREDELSDKQLQSAVRGLLQNAAQRAAMRKVIHTFSDKNTDDLIFRSLFSLISSNSAKK